MFQRQEDTPPLDGEHSAAAAGDYSRMGCRKRDQREPAGRSARMGTIAKSNTGNLLQGEEFDVIVSSTLNSPDFAAYEHFTPATCTLHTQGDQSTWWTGTGAGQVYSNYNQVSPYSTSSNQQLGGGYTYSANYPYNFENYNSTQRGCFSLDQAQVPFNYAVSNQGTAAGGLGSQGCVVNTSLQSQSGDGQLWQSSDACEVMDRSNDELMGVQASYDTASISRPVTTKISNLPGTQLNAASDQGHMSGVVESLNTVQNDAVSSASGSQYKSFDGALASYYGCDGLRTQQDGVELGQHHQPIKFRIRTITDCEFQCPSATLPVLPANCIAFPPLNCHQHVTMASLGPGGATQASVDSTRPQHLPGAADSFTSKMNTDHHDLDSNGESMTRNLSDKVNDDEVESGNVVGSTEQERLCDADTVKKETSVNGNQQYFQVQDQQQLLDIGNKQVFQPLEENAILPQMVNAPFPDSGETEPGTNSRFHLKPFYPGPECQQAPPVKMEIAERLGDQNGYCTAGSWKTFAAICPNVVAPNSPTVPLLPYQRPSWFTADAYSRQSIRMVTDMSQTVPTDSRGLDASAWKANRTALNKHSNIPKKQRRNVDKKSSEEKKFKCNYAECNKKFLKDQELKVHRNKYHLGLKKPYFCDTCDKSFRRPDQLKRHQKIHTGEKPHECSICGRCFARTDHRNTHYNKHSGEKPFACHRMGCNRRFARNDELRRHEAKHNDVVTDPNRQQAIGTENRQVMDREMEGSRVISNGCQGAYLDNYRQHTASMMQPIYALPVPQQCRGPLS